MRREEVKTSAKVLLLLCIGVIEPLQATSVVESRELPLALEPGRDTFRLLYDDKGTCVYESDGLFTVRTKRPRADLLYHNHPGAKPFRGTRDITLGVSVMPKSGGTARLRILERDAGRYGGNEKVFVTPWTTQSVFRTDLDAAKLYQIRQIVLIPAKEDEWPSEVKLTRLEGTVVESAAAAIRLDVDTGSPLHVTTDPVRHPVALTLRNACGRDLVIQGGISLTNYFGDALSVSVKTGIGGYKTKRIPVDLRQAKSVEGRPSRLCGLWRVFSELNVGGTSARSETRFAVLNENPVTPRLRSPKFRMGINYHGQRQGEKDQALTLEALNVCGCKLVRCGGFDFDSTWTNGPDKSEPEPDFARETDLLVAKLVDRGISINCFCYPAPAWASLRPELPYRLRTHTLPKKGLAGDYCERLARHFGTKIDYIETANEADFWQTNECMAVDFAAYQRECYEGVKRGCSEVRVLTPGFAQMDPYAPSVDQKGFQEVVLHKAKGYYDVHAIHQHGSFAGYRKVVETHFLPMRKRLAVTVPWYANETAATCVHGAEDSVAANVWQKILYSWAHGSIDYIWYNLRATGWNPNDPEQNFGLITADFYPRAGFAAFSALANIVTGLDFDRIIIERGSRFLYRLSDRNRIVVAGWDGDANPSVDVRVRTDAVRAIVVDMMGNRIPAKVTEGGFVFPLSRLPGAIVMERATRAEPDTSDVTNLVLPKLDARVLNPQIEGRRPDFILDRVCQTCQPYEANPETIDRTWQGPQDLSARIWIGREGGELRVRFVIQDDIHCQRFDAENLYRGDGVQFILEAPGQGGNFEFGLARSDSGNPLVRTWIVPVGFDSAMVERAMKLTTKRQGDKTLLNLCIPLATIGFDERILENGFRFNAVVYDDDGIGKDRDLWIEICPGIVTTKEYADSPCLKFPTAR